MKDIFFRGNWSTWLKQQLPAYSRDRSGDRSRHQSFAAVTQHKGNKIVIQAGKLFHHWGEVNMVQIVTSSVVETLLCRAN